MRLYAAFMAWNCMIFWNAEMFWEKAVGIFENLPAANHDMGKLIIAFEFHLREYGLNMIIDGYAHIYAEKSAEKIYSFLAYSFCLESPYWKDILSGGKNYIRYR